MAGAKKVRGFRSFADGQEGGATPVRQGDLFNGLLLVRPVGGGSTQVAPKGSGVIRLPVTGLPAIRSEPGRAESTRANISASSGLVSWMGLTLARRRASTVYSSNSVVFDGLGP